MRLCLRARALPRHWARSPNEESRVSDENAVHRLDYSYSW